MSVDDERPEGGQIGVFKIVRRDDGVKGMTLGLGPAVNGEVFGGGDGLEVFGVRTLQAAGKGKSDLTGEERIFSVGLLTAAPSRVAIDVDIGRPQSEAVIDNMVPLALGLVVLGSRFRGDRVGTRLTNPVSQVAASPMACGKTVA